MNKTENASPMPAHVPGRVVNTAMLGVFCAAILAACSEAKSPPPSAASQISGGLGAFSGAGLPKPEEPKVRGDASKPLDQYDLIDRGAMLLAIKQHMQAGGPKYEDLALGLSERYQRETDGFKRQDILATLKPELEPLLQRARHQRYLAVDHEGQYAVDNYDFERGSFEITMMTGAIYAHYFRGDSAPGYRFTNEADFRHMRVQDQAAARRIESMRTHHGMMSLRVYFFVADFNESSNPNLLNAQIMAVAMVDKKTGQVIAVDRGQ